MAMVNKFILQGRLTAAPEIKQTQSGVACANFTVAWSEKYKETETKCFQRCRAWRGTAEFLGKYFTKGQELIVVGKMNTETWEKDGQKNSAQVLVVDEVSFCGSKSSQDVAGAAQGAQTAAYMPDAYAPQTAAGQPAAPSFETISGDDALPF
jgi:single-strand DNA-binding protein